MLQVAYLSKNASRPSTTSVLFRLASKNNIKGCHSLLVAVGEDAKLRFRMSLFSEANEACADIQRKMRHVKNIIVTLFVGTRKVSH